MSVRFANLLTCAAVWAVASLASAPAWAASYSFSTGDPDGKIATGSRPGSVGKLEIESSDDFVLDTTTSITGASFTGLLTGGAATGDVGTVVVEIYRVFPLDSADPPSGNVPTRVNSPSDVAFQSRSNPGGLSFTVTLLNASFNASNSVLNGINKLRNQTTGGEGAVAGKEVRFDAVLSSPFVLPAGHYFFIAQVEVTGGEFLWLSAPKPITSGTGPFAADLQSWIRNENLAPDWLRIGTDVTLQGPFNASFSLIGQSVPDPGTKNSCDAGKLQCLAKKEACLLTVHGKAEKKGVPVDSTALRKCNHKFDGGSKGFAKGCIGKLEGKADPRKPETVCSVTGDLALLEGKVDAFVDDVVSAIDANPTGPNYCNAGKKSCVQKKATCLLRAHQSAVKKGVAPDGAALQKCTDKFDGSTRGFAKGCIGKLETKLDAHKPKTVCSVTGDVGTLEGKVDAFVIGVLSEIRNAL